MRFAVRSIALGVGLTALLAAAGPDYDRAKKLFNTTEFEQSLKVLQAIPDKDGAVYELIGRNLFLLGDFKKSTRSAGKGGASGSGQLGNRPLGGTRLRTPCGDFQRPDGSGIRLTRPSILREVRPTESAQSGSAERSLRVLPGGSRHSWAAAWTKPKPRLRRLPASTPARGTGPGQAGREAQGVLRAPKSSCGAPSKSRPNASDGSSIWHVPVQTGPVPGSRAEPGEGRTDRAQQSEADVRQG